MTGLVLELQAACYSDSVSVVELLRMARVVSVKLGMGSINEWLKNEMDGYPSSDAAPDYRRVRGKLECFNPYLGYIPLGSNDPSMDHHLSRTTLRFPLSEIADIAQNQQNSVRLSFSHQLAHDLMAGMEEPFEPSLLVPVGQFRRIVSSVKDKILNFALDLEQQGIIGDGMTFSKDEKQAASHISYNVNIENMHGSQVQQGTSHSNQVINSAVDLEALSTLIEQLVLVTTQIPDPKARAQFSSDLQTIEAQIAAPSPRPSILRECLQSARSILEGAGGNIAAEQLPALVAMLASLPT
ncbi:hypothetical protein N5C69_19065 [Pseudomonas aeruginosa]|uniref:AbiTii domain-containing protein n=1 Tax=Pseudomonas aeruginosa TaxID=287 RepID=UPI00244B7750|nr:hypothetical protein [Pseudomonas aeruginosa]MDH0765051.1 hypothetical protein [Pseudomonas aeruginosa]MDH1040676.1 hypothetical protein [Pseudomonas aeruginosa]MDH1287627.1 hypothetical protein [Pseudomonas aeruginosa]HBP6240503.1 hypothetical protein [Pseudomonas aeruginosa]HCI2708061.1 hypothetical protein [Pseudomonas aeruginosa]